MRTGPLEYANFGHLPPLILSPDGSVECYAVPSGMILGPVEHAKGGTGSVRLKPGSTLLLYTDGVAESLDESNRLFGSAALSAVVTAARGDDPETIVRRVVASVTDHAGAAEQADDITLPPTRYNGGCRAV